MAYLSWVELDIRNNFHSVKHYKRIKNYTTQFVLYTLVRSQLPVSVLHKIKIGAQAALSQKKTTLQTLVVEMQK